MPLEVIGERVRECASLRRVDLVSDVSEGTSTPRRTHAESADDGREVILDAAVPLIVAHGQYVTTKQIADAACLAARRASCRRTVPTRPP